MYRNQRTSRQFGFTVVEVFVVVAIIGIMASFAVPAITDNAKRGKVASAVSALSADIMFAREEAVSLGSKVTVCASDDASTCGNDWSAGWIVFEDQNGDRVRGEGEAVLRTHGMVDIAVVALDSSVSDTSIQFKRRGETQQQVATISVCYPGADVDYARALTVSLIGATRLSIDSDGDGVHENHRGEALACS